MTSLIFDLDDTLFDTSAQLIGPAISEACAAMIHSGLMCSQEECAQSKKKLILSGQRIDFFTYATQNFEVDKDAHPDEIAAVGRKAFYQRRVPTIHPFDGVPELLNQLKPKYKLFLVTAGHPPTQLEKIRKLQFESFFNKILFADIGQKTSKFDIFKSLAKENEILPQQTLAIGNRIDDEIKFAKMLNMKTCLVRHGEYRYLLPQNLLETPDFTISKIMELSDVCKL